MSVSCVGVDGGEYRLVLYASYFEVWPNHLKDGADISCYVTTNDDPSDYASAQARAA